MSGRCKQNSKIISAVHTPTPLSVTSALIASRSGRAVMALRLNSPRTILSAKSFMYDALRRLMPDAWMVLMSVAATLGGVISPRLFCKRSQTVCRALAEICCPIMLWSTAENGSGSISRSMWPMRSIITPSFLSLLLR